MCVWVPKSTLNVENIKVCREEQLTELTTDLGVVATLDVVQGSIRYPINYGRLSRYPKLQSLGVHSQRGIFDAIPLALNVGNLTQLVHLSLKDFSCRTSGLVELSMALLATGTLRVLTLTCSIGPTREAAITIGENLSQLETLTDVSIYSRNYSENHAHHTAAVLMRSPHLVRLRLQCKLGSTFVAEHLASALRTSTLRELKLSDISDGVYYMPFLHALAEHPTLETFIVDTPTRRIDLRPSAFRQILAHNSVLTKIETDHNAYVKLSRALQPICDRNVTNNWLRSIILVDLLLQTFFDQPRTRRVRQ